MIEALKYQEMWRHPEYRVVAPGEYFVDDFLSKANAVLGDTIADFGCGTGRAAHRIACMTDAEVTAIDFADNCLDPGLSVNFLQHDLTKPLEKQYTCGFCTDVMEHIPPEQVDTVLDNILKAAIRVYFNISTVPDHLGSIIGESLHLTVQPFEWWKEKLEARGFRIDDSKNLGQAAVFWGSAYANGKDVSDKSELNVKEERIKENIWKNLDLGLQEIVPHRVQDTTIYLLAGGPSLNDFDKDIISLGKQGKPMVTVNGTYQWLIDRGVKPAAHVMLDARAFNKRFVETPVDTCRYLISSQCAHEAVVELPKDRTWLFHSGEGIKPLFDEYCAERGIHREWYPVYGGSTVIGRALVLLAMLGFRKIEVFGWDSCLRDDEHHAYEQKENDSKRVVEVIIGGKRFRCHAWMVVQANEAPLIIKHILGKIPDFEMVVHGDGLISHIIQFAASMADKE